MSSFDIRLTGTLTCLFVSPHKEIDFPFAFYVVFLAVQLADFGLAHASRDGSICFEPVNTDIRGTPGDTKEQQLFLS